MASEGSRIEPSDSLDKGFGLCLVGSQKVGDSALPILMITPRAMHVPVRQLILGGIPDIRHLHLKVQTEAGQRMIPIHGDEFLFDGCHRNEIDGFIGLSL